MKSSFLLSAMLLLTGCAIGTSSEIKIAENLLSQFKCNNIDTAQLSHSAITSYHERTLVVSKDKAVNYIDQFKAGDYMFALPLDEVVKQQFDLYKTACESLGGVQVRLKTENN